MRARYPSGRYLLDTCCLIKLLVPEEGRAVWPVNELFRQGRTSSTLRVLVGAWTVVEALGVLKAKRGPKRPDQINQAQYLFAAMSLIGLTKTRQLVVFDPRMSQGRLNRVIAEANMAGVDVLDALQLELMRRLIASAPRSRAVLVTTDGGLESAAVERKIPVWNPEHAEPPRA